MTARRRCGLRRRSEDGLTGYERRAVLRGLRPEPAIPTGLSIEDVHVVRIRPPHDGPGCCCNGREPGAVSPSSKRRASNHGPAARRVGVGAGGTCECRPLPIPFHIVDDGCRSACESGMTLPGLHVDIVAAITRLSPTADVRRQDISLGAVGIFHQRHKGGAVSDRIPGVDGRRHVDLCA